MKGENSQTTILIVEDDESTSALIRRKLDNARFQTICVSTGSEAIEKAGSNPDCLMLLDYNLPDINGGEVIEALREKRVEIPFIVITGMGS